jgi:hypothetical protein
MMRSVVSGIERRSSAHFGGACSMRRFNSRRWCLPGGAPEEQVGKDQTQRVDIRR